MWRQRSRLKRAVLGLVFGGGGGYLAYNALISSTNCNSTPMINPPTNKLPSRAEQLNRLRSTKEFDLLVIGGGATGTGVALDAATRGLNVALVEKEDFASGTSSRSTKLIHGGVRYLEKAVKNLDYEQYKMVREALRERATVLRIAPHLAYELPIMLPIYKYWQVPYFWIGSKAYDLLSGSQHLHSSYFLSRNKALEKFPMLKSDSLVGAIVYYDGAHNDARTNLALALTAASHGATVANHVEVVSLLKKKVSPSNSETNSDSAPPTGQEQEVICGAVVKDRFTGESWEVRAKGVINATGPFTDLIRKMDEGEKCTNLVVPSAGVHIVLPDYYSPRDMGLLDPATSDGRVIFFLPWENSTLSGTTDTPTTITHRPVPMEQEIAFVLNEVSNYLNEDVQLHRGDILSAWSGIRPLVKDPTKTHTEALARNHVIVESEHKLLTIAGGKWTTYREMAEETVDRAVQLFGLRPQNKCLTEQIYLVGAAGYTPTLFIRLIQNLGFQQQVAQHLAKTYGDQAEVVATFAKPTGKRWPVLGGTLYEGYPYLEAEVIHAVRNEYACTAEDILARRLRLAFINVNVAAEVLPRVIQLMAAELGWSDDRQKWEFETTREFLLTMGLVDVNVEVKLNALELLQCRKQFDAIDRDHDGHITKADLKEILKKAEQREVDDREVEELIKEVDKNKNGMIEYNEFLEMMARLRTKEEREANRIAAAGLVALSQHKISTERSAGGL
jgi:glycerol-3-phosphate dehydrogenase